MPMMDALPVDEGRRRMLDAVQPLAPIDLPLAEVYGCVLASDVVTEYDLPPFSSAAADGFAVRAADIHGATRDTPVSLRVAGWVVSGRPPEVTVGWGEAVRIAAGAPLPAGADCVVPMGRFLVEGETVQVQEPVEPGSFIRPAGEDVRAGSVLVPAGRRLQAPELGILAAAGSGSALTYPKVRVGVLSIGPALVEPGRPAALGQIRDANSYALLGALRDAGAVPYRIPIVQSLDADLREAVLSNATRADAFVCAGGVSEEDGDLVGAVLSGLGDVETHRVAMFPGGVLGVGAVEGKPFFSLPGEALAAFMTFEILVRPAVLKTMGRRDLGRPEVRAVLEEEVDGPPEVTLLAPARVVHREGSWRASPTGHVAPNLLGRVVRANGIVVIPPGGKRGAGEQVRVQIFRPLER
jgi:molybdenum cofactor synthesis domain-containing protein